MVHSRQTCRISTGIRIPPHPRAASPEPETAPVQAPAAAPAPGLSGCSTSSRLCASTASSHVTHFSTASSDIQPTASELSQNRREIEEEDEAEEAEFNAGWARRYLGVFVDPPRDPARLAVVWEAAQAERENKLIFISSDEE